MFFRSKKKKKCQAQLNLQNNYNLYFQQFKMQLYDIFLNHPIITTDSRVCPAGSIFFALKGDNFNANAFALSALENGSAYAVVDEAQYAIEDRFILVDDVLESLQSLARYHSQQLATNIIGITGTNGKTTTKELISAALKEEFNVLYTQGNLNNHIGVPLTVLQLKPEHDIAVIEMGANHIGDIQELAEIACPNYGIITNVGKAHLEGFGSFEGVMQTKAELYTYISQFGELVFINKANEFLQEMADDSDIEFKREYSLDKKDANSNYYGEIISCSPFLSMKIRLSDADTIEVNTNLIGSYNAENVLAAATIAYYFGVPAVKIKKGLENYTPQNNRSQLSITDNNKLVVDAYNANPTSMQAAILNFAQMEVNNKTLILGDMLELGEQSDMEHQNIIALLKEFKFENVYLVGSEFNKCKDSFVCYPQVNDLIGHFQTQPINDNYILIKGSRGIQLEKIIPYL